MGDRECLSANIELHADYEMETSKEYLFAARTANVRIASL